MYSMSSAHFPMSIRAHFTLVHQLLLCESQFEGKFSERENSVIYFFRNFIFVLYEIVSLFV